MTTLAIRSGAEITGPTDALAVSNQLVQTPRLVGADGGLDLEERGRWEEWHGDDR